MKLLFRNTIIIVLTMLMLLMLTACQKKEVEVNVEAEIKTTTISLDYYDKYRITCVVPINTDENGREIAKYNFVEEKPDNVEYERRK